MAPFMSDGATISLEGTEEINASAPSFKPSLNQKCSGKSPILFNAFTEFSMVADFVYVDDYSLTTTLAIITFTVFFQVSLYFSDVARFEHKDQIQCLYCMCCGFRKIK